MHTFRRHAAPAILGLSIAALVACSPGSSTLAEREFVSVAVTEAGAPKALVPGTRISIRFTGNQLAAHAGCNTMGGTYRIEGDRLLVQEMSMTAVGCDAPLQAQDGWVAALLQSAPATRIAGNELTVNGGSSVLRLLDREVAEPDLNIVGPTWTVESIIDGGAVSSVPAGATATLVFKADGSFELDAGCNRGGGTWKLEGGGIAFSGLMLTKMACAGPGAQLEGAVLRVIDEGSARASIDANQLTLSREGSGLQLRG